MVEFQLSASFEQEISDALDTSTAPSQGDDTSNSRSSIFQVVNSAALDITSAIVSNALSTWFGYAIFAVTMSLFLAGVWKIPLSEVVNVMLALVISINLIVAVLAILGMLREFNLFTVFILLVQLVFVFIAPFGAISGFWFYAQGSEVDLLKDSFVFNGYVAWLGTLYEAVDSVFNTDVLFGLITLDTTKPDDVKKVIDLEALAKLAQIGSFLLALTIFFISMRSKKQSAY